MGAFLSHPEDPASRGPAASGAQDETTLKGSRKECASSPTVRKQRNEYDGRSYAEVVRAGPEDGTMSELRQPSAAWEFSEAPQEREVPVQERVPDPSRDRQGEGKVLAVFGRGLQKQNSTAHEDSEV